MQVFDMRCIVFGLCFLSAALMAGETKTPPKKKPGHRCTEMEYGPYLAASFGAGKDNMALKGVTVRLMKEPEVNICFDTELMRVSAGWTDGFIDWASTPFNGAHGAGPNAVGKIQFSTKRNPGWARECVFTDPRQDKDGPLPADWAKYKGLYLNGDKVIFSYTVGDSNILELDSAVKVDGGVAFVRTLNMGVSTKPLCMMVCEVDGTEGSSAKIGEAIGAVLSGPAGKVVAAVAGAPEGTVLEASGGRILLKLPPLTKPASFKLVIAQVPDEKSLSVALDGAAENLAPLIKGGVKRWEQSVQTKGVLGADDAPYTVDTLTPPDDNPWKSWMRFGGMDFFADGKRAALCTWSGDVWICSGIDEKLENLTWTRFATGLYQPLGLKIVDDKIYTLGRDQISRLHDLNNDGEADFYECFNNDCAVTPNFHEFAFDLQTDPQGNFYYSKGSPVRGGGRGFERISKHNGVIMKVSKDGSTSEIFATGFRAPNGMGVGPNGEVTSGDNEGTWMPSCPLNLIQKGGFYGVKEAAHRLTAPDKRDSPICWLPMGVDNSGGGQVWVTSDKWGPFKGSMLHLSYGKCSLFKVMYEVLDGVPQGGVVRFPLTFASGINRSRFNPVDGQLYVSGLKGWQTTAAKDGTFQRVRYTGKNVAMPTELHVRKSGIDITFSSALDAASVNDINNWSGQIFNVRWTVTYGSPEFTLSDPLKKGRDPLAIDAVKLSADGKTVSLSIPTIQPVTNMVLKYKIKAADGTLINQEINNTVNIVPAN